MAKGIRLRDADTNDLYYPMTVSDLVIDHETGETVKHKLDHIFESPIITTPIINGGELKNCNISGEETVLSGSIDAEDATINGGTIKAFITNSRIDNCNIENSNFHDGEIGDCIVKDVELDGTINGGTIENTKLKNPTIHGGNSYNQELITPDIQSPKVQSIDLDGGTIKNTTIKTTTSYNQVLYTPIIYGGNFGGVNEAGEQVDLELINPTIDGGTINADSISIKGATGFIKADGTIDDNFYVTTDTVQAISGLKKYSSQNYFMSGLRISEPTLNESYLLQRLSTTGNLTLNHFTGSNMKYLGEIDKNGNLTAYSFIKKNGTSSQFLKADGSVDENVYLTSHQSLADYATKSEMPTKTSQLTNDSGFFNPNSDISTTKNILLSTNSMIQIKEGGYGDKFAIHGKFSGYDDSNKMFISSAVGASGTDPELDIKMTMLLKSGNVGIGTTSPTEKLEVNGNIKAEGFKVDGKTGFLKADGSVDENEYALKNNETLINPIIKEEENSTNKLLYIDRGDLIINDPQINIGYIDCPTINDATLTGEIDLVNTCNIIGGEIQTNKISIKNGTSSQFLKADGSVDENEYLQKPYILDLGTVTGLEDLSSNFQLEDGVYNNFEDAYDNNLNIIIQFIAGRGIIKCFPQYITKVIPNTYIFEFCYAKTYFRYQLTPNNKLTYMAVT